MDSSRANARRTMALVCGAVFVACAFTGCPPINPDVDQHPGKVYFLGDITGTLAEEIQQIFSNLVAYDGTSADAPIFIAGSSVATLTDAEIEGLGKIWNDYYPISVIHADEATINTLLGFLGLDMAYALPEGIAYAELFALDREADGHIFMWSMYPPDETAPVPEDPNAPPVEAHPDTADDQLVRTDIFHAWLDGDEKRVTEELKAYRLEAAEALAAAAKTESTELTQLAQGFVCTKNFSKQGNNYQISHYVYACHSFNATDATDYDWFYIRQEGMFNASPAYTGITQWYNGNWYDDCQLYVNKYRLNNWMDGLTSLDGGVSLMQASPQNANNTTQVTSGVDWNIGGSVGYQGAAETGALNAGVTVHNSTTVTINDCTVTNDSMDTVNNAKWMYEFTKCTQVTYFAYTALNEPPTLSHSTFQPVNQWIWKFAPSVRDGGATSFSSKFAVDLMESHGGRVFGFWISEDPVHYACEGGIWSFTVPLTFPPLIVCQHDLDFSSAGQYKALDISVSRAWTATSNEDWCTVEPTSGTGTSKRVNISVSQNDTGASRTATITFETADGKGKDTMTVYQSKY